MKTKFAFTLLLCAFSASVLLKAQTSPSTSVLKLSATTDNVSGAGESIKINLFHWSTDAERDQFTAAWNLTAPGGVARGGAGGRGGAAGRGGGGGRGGGAARGAPAAATPTDAAPDLPPDPDAVAAVPAARGGGGRGGRGGGGATNAAVVTPASSLLMALQNASVAGYLWTSEVTGYSIRYAYRLPLPNGGQRIVLATDRRLGTSNASWKPAGSAAPTDYEFSLIELRLSAKGDGEGKASLTGKVTIEDASKSIVLDGYDTLPIVFKAVKPQ